MYAVRFDEYSDSLIKEMKRNKNSSKKELQKEIYKATQIKLSLLTFWSDDRELTNDE